jgi:hypothetical protein
MNRLEAKMTDCKMTDPKTPMTTAHYVQPGEIVLCRANNCRDEAMHMALSGA